MVVKRPKRTSNMMKLVRQARASADRKTMHRKRFDMYRKNWDWKGMVGSAACIKWGFRDLENLDVVLKMFTGRTRAVQAGGNIGLFPKRLAEEFAEVVTFEPDENLYNALRINAPERNIKAYRCAVGEASGGVKLSSERRDSSGRASHEGLTHICDAGDIPMVTIDSFEYKECDLIYLDIEGYEIHALRGAVRTIERCRPAICVEINRNIEYYGATADELRTFITSFDYVAVDARNSDEAFLPREMVK